jgi:hypothetical protein
LSGKDPESTELVHLRVDFSRAKQKLEELEFKTI